MSEHSFLLNAAIYLLAAVAFVPTASRLGLGSVIGYLLAGCVIGPFGLALIRDVDAIYRFAEFGVVLMLFVIGLELDVERLWGLRRSVFAGGAVQVVGCGLLLSGAGVLVGLPPAAAFVAGFTLALSSTAIAVQTMSERGVLNSPMGRAAFGVLLFQDLAAIPLIGVVPLLSADHAAAGGSPWLGVVKLVSATLAVIAVGRLVVQPVLRSIARTHLRDVFTAFALLVVIATALLMELAGVSMALGAFSPACCSPAPSTARRWRPTSSPSAACSWACSSSPSACRSISACSPATVSPYWPWSPDSPSSSAPRCSP
jgi:glutathione-regulated potassium-efflux system ancillary protein KefC